METPLTSMRRILVHLLVFLSTIWFANADWVSKPFDEFERRRPNDGGQPSKVAGSGWAPAHATFYGGIDASGTIGGACGYGNLFSRGYGKATTAMSSAIFNNGKTCGACFEIKCDFTSGGHSTKWCHPNAGSITVTGTNLCPENQLRITDGWCNPPRQHFDLSYPMFAKLAQRTAGIVPVQYRRVPCSRSGGIKFCINGNPWFNLVLVFNVAGAGSVDQLAIRGRKSQQSPWYNMRRNWGQNWENHDKLIGGSLSFKVTSGTGEVLEIVDVADQSWQHGLTYACTKNFHGQKDLR